MSTPALNAFCVDCVCCVCVWPNLNFAANINEQNCNMTVFLNMVQNFTPISNLFSIVLVETVALATYSYLYTINSTTD